MRASRALLIAGRCADQVCGRNVQRAGRGWGGGAGGMRRKEDVRRARAQLYEEGKEERERKGGREAVRNGCSSVWTMN